MITELDLQEAIAECEGQKNPNANTCLKLASFYTILDHMRQGTEGYSYATIPQQSSGVILYQSDTEFSQIIDGRPTEEIMPVIDELMTTLKAVYPRLYSGVINRLT